MDLRELREQKLLSQQDLAVRAGVSKTTVVNIEAGAIRPHPSTLRKLADALGVEPAVLAEYLRRPDRTQRSARAQRGVEE
jgi:transcriptional regulator with XRE-family HTH domain